MFFSRRCLEESPQLGIMEELQLLNLQHNLITRIQHLSHLQQLVFLNLYDNHISEMTGIDALSSEDPNAREEPVSCRHRSHKHIDILEHICLCYM